VDLLYRHNFRSLKCLLKIFTISEEFLDQVLIVTLIFKIGKEDFSLFSLAFLLAFLIRAVL
jgi:hypothetical protein